MYALFSYASMLADAGYPEAYQMGQRNGGLQKTVSITGNEKQVTAG